MHHAEEIAKISTGNKLLDGRLVRIGKKMDNHVVFDNNDYLFVNFLLLKKLRCEHCRSVLFSLYLHLQYGRKGTLETQEFAIIGALEKHKQILEIPEVQFVPSGID